MSIYDADTLTVFIDLGFGTHVKQTLRLNRINAPEVRGASRKAGEASRDWLRQRLPVGETVTVLTMKDKKGKYGRYLADIFVGDKCVNDELVNLNLAEYKKYD